MQVIEAIKKYYEFENSNVHRGVHTLGNRATEAMKEHVKKFVNSSMLNLHKKLFLREEQRLLLIQLLQSYGRANVKEGDEIVITHNGAPF